jgi:hypothetical protein
VINLPFPLKRFLPLLALGMIGFILFALPHLDALFFSHMRYEHCNTLAANDPKAALKLAQGWRKGRPDSPMARHCEAIALFATRDYSDAGDSFLALGKEAAVNDPPLAVRLFIQAGKSYETAKKYDLARQSAASAVMIDPNAHAARDLLAEINKENPPVPPPEASPAALAPAR